MLNSFFEAFLFLKYALLCLFIVFAILSLFWEKIFSALNFKLYQNVQRVHKNEISRLGGFFIYVFFALLACLGLITQDIIVHILISAIPFILISLKEDIFHNTSPRLRLILMVMSCLIFFYINPIDLPIIDLPFLGSFISLYPIGIIFFTFSILVIMNGMNLIDGMNGIFGFTAIIQLISLASISFYYGDSEIVFLSMIFVAPLIIFIFFNFPLGKIFIGDTGAYFYGFVIAILTIYVFGKYNQLLSWLAVLILFYPCIELLFSFVRKKLSKTNPLDPDNLHLHTVIFKVLNKQFKNVVKSNYTTTLCISLFFISPGIIALFYNNQLLLIILFLVVLLALYILLYLFFYRICIKNKL